MFEPRHLTESVTMRLLRPDDAAALAAAFRRNRKHLEPTDPTRSEEFFTEEFQRQDIEERLGETEAGEGYPLALIETNGDGDGEAIIGRFNFVGIKRGPFQSALLGYWVDQDHAGRGLATAAVQAIIAEARDTFGLHRIEATTLLDNVASQRVLLKNGFVQYGMAPRYLHIAGVWRDHNLYQVLLHD